jgi:hypothetical protein
MGNKLIHAVEEGSAGMSPPHQGPQGNIPKDEFDLFL